MEVRRAFSSHSYRLIEVNRPLELCSNSAKTETHCPCLLRDGRSEKRSGGGCEIWLVLVIIFLYNLPETFYQVEKIKNSKPIYIVHSSTQNEPAPLIHTGLTFREFFQNFITGFCNFSH